VAKTVKRKPLASSKYYFFDSGVGIGFAGKAFLRARPNSARLLKHF